MSFGHIFKGDLFGVAKITNYLNFIETPSVEMRKWLNWNEDYSLLTDVAIDQERGLIYVLDSIGDTEPLPVAKEGERGTYKIEIPRFGERASLLNRSLLGVRQTGSEELIVFEAERNKRLNLIEQRLGHTEGWLMTKALEGKIYDGSGVLLADFYVKQERGQIIVDIDLTNAKVDVNDELVLIKQICEYVLGETEISATGYKLICGFKANQFLRTNASVKAAQVDAANTLFLRNDNRDGILMAGNVNIVDHGNRRHKGVGFIDEGNDPTIGIAYFVPEAQNFAQIVYGPSGMNEHLGKPNKFYGWSKPTSNDDGVNMFGESYMIPFFMHHRAIIKVRIKGVPQAANAKLAAIVAAEAEYRSGSKTYRENGAPAA